MSKRSQEKSCKWVPGTPRVVGKASDGVLVAFDHKKGRPRRSGRVPRAVEAGYYVYVWRDGGGHQKEWVAVCPCFPDNPDNMKFLRLEDAQRAADSLIAAGLDTFKKISTAKPELIRKIACENLAW